MHEFVLKRRSESEKTGAVSYLFASPEYTLSVHAWVEEGRETVAYPIQAKPAINRMAIMPAIVFTGPGNGHLDLPPTVLVKHLPKLRESLRMLECTAEGITRIVSDIESGQFAGSGNQALMLGQAFDAYNVPKDGLVFLQCGGTERLMERKQAETEFDMGNTAVTENGVRYGVPRFLMQP